MMRGIESVEMVGGRRGRGRGEEKEEGEGEGEGKGKGGGGCGGRLERLGRVMNSLLRLRNCLREWGEEEELWYGGGKGGKGWRGVEGEGVKVSAGVLKMICEALAEKYVFFVCVLLLIYLISPSLSGAK